MKNARSIFGEFPAKILENLSLMVDDFRKHNFVYNFISEQRFERIAQEDISKAGTQYWQEILDRVHFSSATSIIRTVNWINAIDAAYESDNFLSFLSSVRSLTEFSGDAVHSLNQVPLTLAKNNSNIRKMLNGKAKAIFASKELEDALIHYTHARKLKPHDASVEAHRAKQTYEYVKELEPYAPKIYEMYTELCAYAHPAAQSVGAHMSPLTEDEWVLIVDPGHELISAFISNWRSQYAELPMIATNQAICSLKILSLLDEKRYGTDLISRLNLSGIPLWNKCKSHIRH